MMRRFGYVPKLHFKIDDGSYRGQHRPGLRLWWRRALLIVLTPVKRLARHLDTLRTAARLTVPVRPPKLTLLIHVDTRSFDRGLAKAGVALTAAVGHLTRMRGARASAPDRDTARRPGAHRLENLSHMANAQYALCMHTRAQYIERALARLAKLAVSGRVFGETSWKEARRADRYAHA